MAAFKIAVAGAGLIGRAHMAVMAQSSTCALAAIADPTDAAKQLATEKGVPWFATLEQLLANVQPDGVVLATPNTLHVPQALQCIAAGVPVLVEKPIAPTVEQAQQLVQVVQDKQAKVLIGHHRAHSSIMAQARAIVQSGRLGRLVSVMGSAMFYKPAHYFDDAPWRRAAGGGPILINMIHDIDLLRFLLGEVVSVQAQTSNAIRGFEVEDTASALLRFENGALAALNVSDAAVAPWNWDFAAGEASHYAKQDVDAIFITGTEASITLPQLQIFSFKEKRGWHEPLTQERTPLHRGDPYVAQLAHIRAVAEGHEVPVCSGWDGLQTLRTTLAVHEAARSGQTVQITPA